MNASLRLVLQSADADADGFVGWGLNYEWDAFADGTTNPAFHEYSVTTALALEGLLAAHEVTSLEARTRAQIGDLVVRACVDWSERAFTFEDHDGGGYYWYSPRPEDAIFVPNVVALFAGQCQRALTLLGMNFAEKESTVQRAVDAAITLLVEQATATPEGPRWLYAQSLVVPNDLVHHAYIIIGLESYRLAGGTVPIPWNRADLKGSLNSWWVDGTLMELAPSDARAGREALPWDRPARLYGVAAALLVEGLLG